QHPDQHSFPTRRSSDLLCENWGLVPNECTYLEIPDAHAKGPTRSMTAANFPTPSTNTDPAPKSLVAGAYKMLRADIIEGRLPPRSEEHTSELQSLRHLV